MKLRLRKEVYVDFTYKEGVSEPEKITENWVLEEIDANGKKVENGYVSSAVKKELLLEVIDRMRKDAVEEFYEL